MRISTPRRLSRSTERLSDRAVDVAPVVPDVCIFASAASTARRWDWPMRLGRYCRTLSS